MANHKLRYHFLWVCPGDLRIIIATKAAHATPRDVLDRVSLVSDFLLEPRETKPAELGRNDAVME